MVRSPPAAGGGSADLRRSPIISSPGNDSVEHDAEADGVLDAVRPLVAGIQTTLGRVCEVALHDFRLGDHSVVAIEGDVTHRGIGSPMSEIGLALQRRGSHAKDNLNYITRLPDGRVMKSSTMLLRTGGGELVGALCINLDITQLRGLTSVLDGIVGAGDDSIEPVSVTFGTDVETVLDSVLNALSDRLGKPLTNLSQSEWTVVFHELEERGVFQIRRAASLLAARLGISRATVYNYRARIVQESDPDT